MANHRFGFPQGPVAGGGNRSPRSRLSKCQLWSRQLAVALLFTALTGCGFHLRGAYQVPASMTPAYVESPASEPLRRALVEVLRSSNVTLVSAPDQARMILRVISVTEDSRVASVDASGKVLEYQLRFQTQFDARDAKGEELIPSQTVTMARTYLNPDVEVLGKQQEAATIRAEMIRDVADRIVRRLQTQAR